MKHLISSLLIILPLLASSQKTDVQYPKISKEIQAMRGPDQAYRIKWMKLRQKGKQGTKKYKQVTEKLKSIDRENTARMREIVDEIGWPTFDKVGRKASNTAWLIVQHADRRPHFQARCLPLLKAAVEAGQAEADDYAYLYDRVQVAKGGKQLYATQTTTDDSTKERFFQAIEDEAKVQERRTKMGVEQPIEAYAQSMGFTYTVPTQAEAEAKVISDDASFNEAVRLARKAMTSGDFNKAAEAYLKASNYYGRMSAEDYIATARSISLAKHEAAGWAYVFLMKAIMHGYPKSKHFDLDSDFNYLKLEGPENWEDLLVVVKEAQE